MTWTLTGFADEISPDLDEQLDTLAAEQMRYLELRGVWGKNVLKLSDDELRQVKATLDDRGVKVSSIGSPIGKIKIGDDFAPHLEEFRRTLYCARALEAPFIRIFSFFIPQGDDPAKYRDEVIARLGAIAKEAEGHNVTLLHENEKEIYGDVPTRCLDIITSVNSPVLRVAWDPANFVQCGVRPHTEGYPMLRPYIAYVHVKDALLGSGQVVPAGQGDGQVRDTVAALKSSGFDGFFSLEPHLKSGGTYAGFSGPDLFRTAVQAFKGVLAEQGIEWE
jgi:sugar phosphate isomerase/epimerase